MSSPPDLDGGDPIEILTPKLPPARFVDLDNDGLLDLFIANGRVTVDSARASAGEDPFAQDDQLFLGRHCHDWDHLGSRLRDGLPF